MHQFLGKRCERVPAEVRLPLDNGESPRHVEIVCAALARVNVSAFCQPLTPPTDLGLLASPRAAGNPGRAARGSVASRKMACRPAARGETFHSRFKAIDSRWRGQPRRCPFLIGTKMDARLILKRASASSGKAADVIEALHLTRIAHNLDRPFR